MPEDIRDSDAFRGATFTRADLAGATFRDVDLTGARVIDAVLVDVEMSGLIQGLRVNGVSVGPLIEAELDRQHPERIQLRATDPAGVRVGWATVEAFWAPTIELARGLSEDLRQARVDGEWSLVETLRHLVFVIDSWFRRAVAGEPEPYHPLGLPPDFVTRSMALRLDLEARPSFDEVLEVRTERMDRVRMYLDTVDAATLAAPRGGDDDLGYPPPSGHTVLSCLHVVMDEEWNHHQYAIRDLATLMASATSGVAR